LTTDQLNALDEQF